MRLLIPGDGRREEAARAESLRRGHTLPAHGPWDAVLLSLPQSDITLEEADLLPRGQKVICGRTNAAFDCLAARRGWRLLRLLSDEAYLKENALLTAEGAAFTAMEALPLALRDVRCLVVGYGRVGKALTKLLRAMDVHVTVAARRPEAREEAGEGSVSLPEITALLPETDVVFNTVPVNLFTQSHLSFLPSGALYVELASPPYGIQPESAKQTEVRYILASGLPGKYCPRSDARALMDAAERLVRDA